MSENVFRAKGILWFSESTSRHIFQLSGKRYDIDASEWSSPSSNQLVFIGRNLNPTELQQQLTNCLD